MKILVINAGSSSLKYQFINIDTKEVLAKGLCERIGIEGSKISQKAPGKEEYVCVSEMKDHGDAIKMVIDALTSEKYGVISKMDEIDAVGHRVVHGGEAFNESVVITAEVKKAIEDCCELAPLHNPANLIGIEACEKIMPNTPQVAVFDTAFHQTMPRQAYLYALPYEMYEKHKIRRYGFHGTSHKYVTQQAEKLMGKDIKDLKIITLHLGNGSSITAVDGGKSIDTSMGFTPLAGVAMGTRCGDIDPAIVTFLMEKEGWDTEKVNAVMNKDSGVFGLSGLSSDFRDLANAKKEGNERATLALEKFIYTVRQFVGAYSVAMGGVDALVFTAGIGENDATVREEVCKNLEYLGVELDKELNITARSKGECFINKEGSKVKVMVIPTNEELMIALDTAKLV